jgi:hypothetical protein
MNRSISFGALPLALGAALALTACATSYEQRIETRLVAAGLSRPISRCMAERLVRRLSTAQLSRLGRAAQAYRGDPRDMTIRELTRQMETLGDPQIVEVVTRAGIGCAIAG